MYQQYRRTGRGDTGRAEGGIPGWQEEIGIGIRDPGSGIGSLIPDPGDQNVMRKPSWSMRGWYATFWLNDGLPYSELPSFTTNEP